MGIFKSTRLLYDVAPYIDRVAPNVITKLKTKGFEVDGVKMPSGDWDISLKQGSLLKAVLGLQTALKVTLSSATPHVYVKAGVGIFGQQAIPTILTTCIWWPFAITQIWGLIKQSRLDKIVIDEVQSEFSRIIGRVVRSKDLD